MSIAEYMFVCIGKQFALFFCVILFKYNAYASVEQLLLVWPLT